MQEKKSFKQATLWVSTHDKIEILMEHYQSQQDKEFGDKAKKISKAALIDSLVAMKLHEVTMEIEDK